MIYITATRRMVVHLAVSTAAIIGAAVAGRLHFNDPQNSGWLGVI